jgi:signal transduction histidine kinase
MRTIGKAMTQIDKRKYGHRLKIQKNDPFAKVYEKVNLALQRLEQLDSVQRNAVQRKNVLLNEMKTFSRYMDMMAHEVKNPLHALGINLDVLKTKVQKGKPKKDVLKHSEILEHEIDHLQEVIQGFLSYVRPGVPRKERLKINNLIKDVCEMVAPEAEKSKISIETRLGKNLSDILIDRGQFQQALHNLLINALHATGAGGKVSIRSWAKRKKVLVSIKDTGTGIAKEQLQQIFDLYFTTKKNGTGLGLPISKRIVEANGGQMQLDSKLDKGTTIIISLQSL